ncbi:MAG: HesA/MoeB/ThiF family protein [Candidatus Omnitrophica bacterium]|nr:HesA/MoeB/ThiF family protein [Candidatus Omnitrophota bacterium]
MKSTVKTEFERYERHIIERSIGVEGQQKIMRARVIMIGAGGLGSSAAVYLAAAGIGTLAIVDNDTVHLSNLNRQVLYMPCDISHKKVDVAAKRVFSLNPDIVVTTRDCYVDNTNVKDIIKGYDIVIDATDNLASKYLLNDTCVRSHIPLVHAGVQGFIGQIMVIAPGSSCLRCFMPNIPQDEFTSDNPRPVVGVTAGLVGQLQAAEVLKLIIGAGDILQNTMLFVDLLTMEFKKKHVPKKATCAICA